MWGGSGHVQYKRGRGETCAPDRVQAKCPGDRRIENSSGAPTHKEQVALLGAGDVRVRCRYVEAARCAMHLGVLQGEQPGNQPVGG
jgi:hypothetical protein